MSSGFYKNCSLADESHLLSCHCHDGVVDERFLLGVKVLDPDTPDDLMLRQVKSIKRGVVKSVGEDNALKGVRCKFEVGIVDGILGKFEVFDLSIPTYALIVNSVINQALISFRLSSYLSGNNLMETVVDKHGGERLVVNGAVDYLTKVDKLIIDACEKMHKLKYGEKHVNENVSNSPRSIDDLFQAEIVCETNDEGRIESE